MKKFLLLLAMACLVPFMGQAQVKSTGRVDATQTSQVEVQGSSASSYSLGVATVSQTQAQINDAQKLEQIMASKKAAAEVSLLTAPHSNGVAYSVNPSKFEDSEALISIGGQDLYHFTLNDPAGAVAYGTAGPEFLNAAEYVDGMYYVATSTSGMYMTVDPATGAFTTISTGNPYHVIALGPGNQMYGLTAGEGATLYTVDVATGASEVVAPLGSTNFMLGFSISNDGRLFTIDAGIDGISEFDLTGALVAEYPAGFTVNYGQDMATDFSTNEIYWAAFNAGISAAQLYKFDANAGTFDMIGTFSTQASCFAIQSTANLNVPASPSNFVATPVGDELLVELSWTNPSTTLAGDPLTDLVMVLTRNGEVLAEYDPATIGGEMTYTDSDIPAAGQYSYSVKAMNAEGVGGSKGASVMVGPMCAYTFNLVDSYGDGWNGAAILVTNEAGETVGSATIAGGASASIEVAIPTGIHNLVWQAGSYDAECSFEVLYPWGEVMVAYDAAPAGTFYTWTNTCTPPTCPRPSGLVTTLVTDAAATLQWTENGTATTWEIEYGPMGFMHGEGTLVEVTENPATIEGLASGTYYSAYVRSVCGADDISDWSNEITFATAVACGEGFEAVSAVIGNGTSGSYKIPMNTFYNYSYAQELYTAEELSAQGAFFGEINTIALEHFGEQVTDVNLQVLMSNVELDNLAGGWCIDQNNMTLVYDGVLNLEPGTGFNLELQLQTPFTYDGASNLLVTFVYARKPYVGTTPRFYTHATDETMAIYIQNDTAPYGLYDIPSTPQAYSGRNNLKFGMCVTDPEYVTASGVVLSTLTNEPVAGASVKFQGALGSTVITDENGEYSLDLVQLFDYNVTITANGYNTYTETVTAPQAATVEFDFAINQPTIAVDPEEVVASTYFMQNATEEVTIINDGTGTLTWNATCIMDDAERGLGSQAHYALNMDVYNFTLEDPAGATPAGFSHSEFLNAAVYVNGVTYYASSTSGMFGIIDYEAGAIETLGSNMGISTVTYNADSEEIVVITSGPNPVFSAIDPTTLEMTTIVTATTSDIILGGAFSPDGRLFIIDPTLDGIAEVNMETGEVTPFWTGGFTVNYGQDVEWDFEDGILYWAAYNADLSQGQLYSIDIETAEGTMIGTFAGQASALVIETVSGAGPWLTVEPKKGEIAAGEEATFTVTMDGWHGDNGVYTGSIELANNTVEGLTVVPVEFTINPPACDAPTNFVGEVVDFNNISLTWDAPTGAYAYGLFYGDDREPFATIEDTYFIDENLEPGVYTYKVRALYEDGCMSASPEAVTLEAVQPYRVVTGTVTSTLDNAPVAEATITFQGTTYIGPRTIVATTAADGTYTANVFVGEYQVTAIAAGFNPYYVENFVVADAALTLDFAMQQPQIELSDLDVVIETGYMNQGIHEMTITNNGTGELTWSVDIECEEEEKSLESAAHAVIGGQDVYNFTLEDPAGATAAGFSHSEFLNSAVYVNGVTYYASSTSGMFGIIDYETGTIETMASGLGIGGVSFNPADGQLYVGVLGENAQFYTIDPVTAEMTSVFTAGANFVLGFAFSPEGVMYAIDAENDAISTVDMSTGEFTVAWTGGFTVNYGQDVEWDFEDNLLYWAAFNADLFQAQLYSIDVEAGEGTMIGTFADQTSALVIETAAGANWLAAEPKSGTVAAGETATFNLIADGWYAEYGTFNATATVNSNAADPIVVPVTFIINPPACDPVTNPAIDVVDFNDIVITWGAPENADGVIAYGIYNYDEKVPFAQVDPSELEFVLNDQEPGDYGFRVRAIYEDGCVSMSEVLLECTTTEAFGTVFGYVKDAYSGEAIVNATVKISNAYTTTTDVDGFYSIDVVVGTYENVKISADSYQTLTIESIYVDVYDNPMDFELVSKFSPVANLTGEYVDGAVTLTWEAPAANGTKENEVLYQGFDDGVIPEGWTTVDADGDGYNWVPMEDSGVLGDPYAGASMIRSASYDNPTYTPLTPDNWLITPALEINGGTVHYYVGAQDAAYPADHYGVYYSLDGTDPSSFELLFEETLTAKSEGAMTIETIGKDGAKAQGTWYEREIALDGINATEVYIAFRHFDCSDMFIINMDEVTISSNPSAPTLPTNYMVERDGEELAMLDAETFTFVDSSVESGTYNYCVTAVYDNILSAPACVEVECGLLGDANGDGVVNVGDVTAIVAYIFNMNPPTFVFANADVNGDGSINVNDIQGVVVIVYGAKGTCEVPNVQYQISNGVLYMNNDAPVAAFQIALSNSNVKALAFDEFITATGTTEDGYVFLAYNFDGKVFEAGTHALLQVNDAEVNYFLTSTACGDAAEGVENAFLGIEENNFSAAYPNPFSTFVTVNNSANAEFVVTSITGQVVYRETTSSNFVWTPANVNSGVYFINVYVDGVNVQTSKVVYQK